MSVTFTNTTTRVETNKWFSVEGAPTIEEKQSYKLLPVSARFTFVNGVFESILVSGAVVRKDGSVSDRLMGIAGIYKWNREDWPVWLRDVYAAAISDMVLTA